MKMRFNVKHDRPGEALTRRAIFADLNSHRAAVPILVVSAGFRSTAANGNPHAGISFSLNTTTAMVKNMSAMPANKSTEPHGTVPLFNVSAGL